MSETQDTKFEKKLIQTTVRIGKGTGFLCSFASNDNDPDIFFVVSNKHILKDFTEKTDILFSCPPNDYYKRSLRPIPNWEVYFHPDKIDLACVLAYQKIHTSTEQFHLYPLTWDYFTEPQTPISSNSKLTIVGYPNDQSTTFHPLIQEEQIVCDINLKDHHLAIKPHLNEGASGSPVFIESDGQFFVLGVVEKKNNKLGVSFIIKQRYVLELLDYAKESFKQHHEMIPDLPRQIIG